MSDDRDRIKALEQHLLALEARIVAVDDKTENEILRMEYRLDLIQTDVVARNHSFLTRLGWLLYGH